MNVIISTLTKGYFLDGHLSKLWASAQNFPGSEICELVRSSEYEFTNQKAWIVVTHLSGVVPKG